MVRHVVKQILVGALLCGLVAFFISIIFSKRKQAAKEDLDPKAKHKRMVANHLTKEWGMTVGGVIDDLDKPLLEEAQAAASDIAELRKKNEAAIVWGELLVPVSAQPRRQRDVEADYLKYLLLERDAYRELTKDTGPAKAAGERFVEAYLNGAAVISRQPLDYPELLTLGNAAIEAGSFDPMVRTYLAYVKLHSGGDKSVAEQAWGELLDELPKTKYPLTVQIAAAQFLYEQAGLIPETTHRWRRVVTLIIPWLEQESGHPDQLQSVCRRLWSLWLRKSDADHESLLYGLLPSAKIDPYIKHVIAGDYYVTIAWKHRSGDYYSGLTTEQRENFAKYLRIAADHLQCAWKLQPQLPYAPERMIKVAMAGEANCGRPYFWFLQTIDAQFDRFDAYQFLSTSLLSRWGGSPEQLAKFAENCVDTNRFQTVVPFFLIEIAESLHTKENLDSVQSPLIKKLLRHLAVRRIKYRAENPENPLYGRGTRYPTRLVLMLEKCGLYDLAAETQRAERDDLDWTMLSLGGRPARYLEAIAFAFPDHQQQWRDFDDRLRRLWSPLYSDDRVTELTKEFHALQDLEPNPNEHAREFYHHVETILDHLANFSAGRTVAVTFSKSLPGVEPFCDQWSVENGAIELSARQGRAPQICLRPLANFAPPFEVQGRLQLLDPPPYLEQVGIGLSRDGMTAERDRLADQPMLWIKATEETTANGKARRDDVTVGMWSASSSVYRLDPTGNHRIRLRLWPNYIEAQVDDRAWLQLPVPKLIYADGWLSLGAIAPNELGTKGRHDAGSMRWSDVTVRRLEFDPPPADTEPIDKRTAYWEKRFADDPDDAVAFNGYCGVRIEQLRYDEVLALAEDCLAKHPRMIGVHRWRGMVLQYQAHDYPAALREYQIEMDEPHLDPEVVSRIAEIRAAAPDESLRDPKETQSLSVMLLQDHIRHARMLAATAAAAADQGDFAAAVKRHHEAIQIAKDTEKLEWEPRLKLYESQQPFRLPAAH